MSKYVYKSDLQQKRATDKVIRLLATRYTKQELSEEVIGISRPTLDKRLINKDWKKSEMALIERL